MDGLIKAYVVRHGSTTISPAPEGWLQVGLDTRGIAEAYGAADFMERLFRDGYPKPNWGVSSDLLRAEQTLQIMAFSMGIRTVTPMYNLRAFEVQEETAISYEYRNIVAFETIMAKAAKTNTIPLIACHRSSTAFLGKQHGALAKNPDYRKDMLLMEGGMLAITSVGIEPLYRVVKENWK